MDRRAQLFWRKVRRKNKNGCRLWSGVPDIKGYGQATLNGYQTGAHRIAYILTYGKIPEGMVVMHVCDTRLCCNPDHLRIGTQAENLADMRAKGRGGDYRNFGEAHGRCKLTAMDVEQIKHLYATTRMSQQAIADRFGVGQSQIGRILRGEGRLRG